MYAGVKFIDGEQLDALEKFGYCAFVLSAEECESNHPEIGDVVHFLIDDSSRGRRCPARLIADQKLKGGGCISIYSPYPSILSTQD